MRAGKQRRGAPALLFDRLVTREQPEDGRGAARVRDIYDMAELTASIREQLGWLLNTRVPVDQATLEARAAAGARSTIDYGLPDLSGYPRGDAAAMARLAEHIGQTIRRVEPRLERPQVLVAPSEERGDQLDAEVAGCVRIGTVVEPVVFRLPISLGGRGHGH